MKDLIIDPEFRDKIPPMPKEDFDGLRGDILRDGYVRDPLVVWEEENILLDGHHRWKVIKENWELLKDQFSIDYKSFQGRWAAIAWICANQLHKHNMTELQRMKLLQEEHDARQKSWGGTGANQFTVKQSGKTLHSASVTDAELYNNKTRATIAMEHNITAGAVKTAVEVGRGIDRAAEVDRDFKNEILAGEVKASKKDLAEIRKMTNDEDVKSAIDNIRHPKPKAVKNPNIPSKPRSRKTEEDQRIAERVDRIIEIQNDSNRDTSITIQDLAELVEEDGKDYVSSLQNMLTVRSALLVGDNRKVIAEVIENIISEICKVKELLK